MAYHYYAQGRKYQGKSPNYCVFHFEAKIVNNVNGEVARKLITKRPSVPEYHSHRHGEVIEESNLDPSQMEKQFLPTSDATLKG